MNEDNHTPGGALVRAHFAPRRARSAADRLVRNGLISESDFARLFAAESADWARIMATDEATLDAELGEEEVAAINALAGRGAVGVAAPKLQLIEADSSLPAPAPYRQHYRLRLAGVDGGLMVPSSQMDAEVKKIRRLLMACGQGFSPDVVHDLQRYVYEGQVLLAERILGGAAEIEGCVAFEPLDLFCADENAGGFVKRRVNLIRLVAVSAAARRSSIAVRLCLEALLRGTVRVLYDAGPACIGTAGIIPEVNERALAWAQRLNGRVRVFASRAKAVVNDPTLAALRDHIESHKENATNNASYRFVVANRTQLLEAASYHLRGLEPYSRRRDTSIIRIDYDREDPCSSAVHKVAKAINSGDRAILQLLGLSGNPDSTVWGPPMAGNMSMLVSKPSRVLKIARAGAAA